MLDEKEAIEVLRQQMDGFKELVKHKYLHIDIKPDNSLIKNEVHKISDFGLTT